jgi:hypothetical protein
MPTPNNMFSLIAEIDIVSCAAHCVRSVSRAPRRPNEKRRSGSDEHDRYASRDQSGLVYSS